MKYKKKGLRDRGDGIWQARFVHDDPVTGEPVITYHTIYANTEKQAKKKRDDLLVELEMGGIATCSDMTVREFMDSFLAYKAESKTIESSTIRDYKIESNRICRYVGGETLGGLTLSHVNTALSTMSEEGYAPRTINKCFRLLKQALNYAIAKDLITKNPCDFCKPPKRGKTPINALSREDRSRMLDLARNALPALLAVAIVLILTTGMRRGEACGLRWSDHNPAKSTITINRAIGVGIGGVYEKEPRSSKTRTIPLVGFVNDMLIELRELVEETCKRVKIPFDDFYIIGTIDKESHPYHPVQLGRDFVAFCKMNNFDCTLHDLRHTFATFMIAEGTDIITVANYLGHASPSMTLDIYADVDPDAKARAVTNIEKAFDDPRSVFKRDAEKRRLEIEMWTQDKSLNQEDDDERSKNAIPYTKEELLQMLGALEAASA